MRQPQQKISNILEFDDGPGGKKWEAIDMFIAALSLDDAINADQFDASHDRIR